MSFSPYIVTSEVPSTRSFISLEDDSLFHSLMELAYQINLSCLPSLCSSIDLGELDGDNALYQELDCTPVASKQGSDPCKVEVKTTIGT